GETLAELIAVHVRLGRDPELPERRDRRQALELAGDRLRDPLAFARADLERGVAVARSRAKPGDDVRRHLEDRDGHHRAVRLEDLGHARLASDQSNCHYILISMSTPAGSESRIRASTVFDEGSRMSTSRLWVRISNCSR